MQAIIPTNSRERMDKRKSRFMEAKYAILIQPVIFADHYGSEQKLNSKRK
jgi:hypothetical protein